MARSKGNVCLVCLLPEVVGIGNRSIRQVRFLVAVFVVLKSHVEVAQPAGLTEDCRGLDVNLLVIGYQYCFFERSSVVLIFNLWRLSYHMDFDSRRYLDSAIILYKKNML